MRTQTLKNKKAVVHDMRGEIPEDLPKAPRTYREDRTDEEIDRDFYDSAKKHADKLKADFEAQGYCVLQTDIGWSFAEWVRFVFDPDPLNPKKPEPPPQARRVKFTLAIPTGGPKASVQVELETYISKTINRDGTEERDEFLEVPQKVTVFYGGRYYPGKFTNYLGTEMTAATLALRLNPPAHVMREALAAILAIDDHPDLQPALYAALLPGDKCQVCGRRLNDHVSQVLQIGPSCAKAFGLPHNKAMAEAVTALRNQQKRATQ